MRNLKKFLALALAVMMVFSLMVTVNATSLENPVDQFPDADELTKTYQQAMNFLVELKLFKGRKDGDQEVLAPKGTFTRAEFAALLYMVSTADVALPGQSKSALLNAMKDYGDYYFDDIVGSYSDWAVDYINYAASMGWVNGDGNRHYNPDEQVSTYQVMLGLLHVMGLGKDIKGANWMIETAQLAANKEHSIIGNVTSFSGYATRELVAQLTFNAMFAQGVDERTEKYFVVALTKDYETAVENAKNTANALNSTSGYDNERAAIEAARKVSATAKYDEDYTIVSYEIITKKGSLSYTVWGLSSSQGGSKGDGYHDEYGRPLTVYTNASGVVRASVYRDLVLASDEDGLDLAISGQTLYDELKHNARVTVRYTDISNVDFGPIMSVTNTGYEEFKYYYTVDADGKVNAQGLGGNGVHVEIFDTDNNPYDDWLDYTAVVISPAFGQVTNVRSYKETPSTGAFTEYTVKVKDSSYTLYDYSSTKLASEETNVTINGDVARNDYVLIDTEWTKNVDDYWVPYFTLTPVTKISGAITSYSQSGVYTIGGQTYVESNIVGAEDLTLKVNGETHTFALDGQGNVVAQLPDGAVDANYIFVLDAGVADYLNAATNKIEQVVEVTGINQDGKLITLQVNRYNSTSTTSSSANKPAAVTALKTLKQVWTYTYDRASGMYNLTSRNNITNAAVKSSIINSDGSHVLIDNTTTLVTAAEASAGGIGLGKAVYASASTKYYVAVHDGTKYSGVNTYTGYSHIGRFLDVDNYDSKRISIIDVENDGVAEIVFVEAVGNNFNAYAYVLDKADIADNDTYIYDAYINGEWTKLEHRGPIDAKLPALVEIKGGVASALKNTASNISTDSVSKVSTFVFLNNVDAYGEIKDTFTWVGGLLVLDNPNGGYSDVLIDTVDATVPVYIFRNNTAYAMTAKDLVNDGGTWVVFVSDGAKIQAIYIVEDGTPDNSLTGSVGEAGAGDEIEVPAKGEDGAGLEIGTVKTGAKITVEEGGELTIKGEIQKGADITVQNPSDIKVVPGTTTVNEAVKVDPANKTKGLDVKSAAGLAGMLSEDVIYSVTKEALVGKNGTLPADLADLFKDEDGKDVTGAVIIVKFGDTVAPRGLLGTSANVTVTVKTESGNVVWTSVAAAASEPTPGEVTPGNAGSNSGSGNSGSSSATIDTFALNLQCPENKVAGNGTGELKSKFVANVRYTIVIMKDGVKEFEGSFTAPVGTTDSWMLKSTPKTSQGTT